MLVAILTHNQESNTIFKMNIRKEESKDYKEVFNLIENAIKNEEYTDHKEHFLVERLRNSESFVPELSLVAEIDGQIVGYILLTKIKIINDNLEETASLALRSEGHTSELQSLMRISYAVFCLKKKNKTYK